MTYENILHGRFLKRLNRFTAMVEIDGREVGCHVKNTGRLRELLLPGADCLLSKSFDPTRKTKFDLISVYREDGALVNIDSLAPNRVAAEYLPVLFPDLTQYRREYAFGESRLDFYAERASGKKLLMEVKGVTLLRDGAALFPDAPTERGIKHIRELSFAVNQGYDAYLLFVVQMPGAKCVRPNDETHPAFGTALREAVERGVQPLAMECRVAENALIACRELPVEL